MRLPLAAHTSRPWRIHEITEDFEVEDVWALPTPGGLDDFGRLVDQFEGTDFPAGAPLYRTDDEWAGEMANSTCHAVLHLSWVPDRDGYRGQMAILVKPNGRLGAAYMLAIKPFRYLFVYPALLRVIGRGWPDHIAAP